MNKQNFLHLHPILKPQDLSVTGNARKVSDYLVTRGLFLVTKGLFLVTKQGAGGWSQRA